MLDALADLRDRVASLVRHRAQDDPTATDPLRGLVLSPEAVTRLLTPIPVRLPCAPVDPDDRTARLAKTFALSGLDLQILLAAAAPDIDRRFEGLYGYLNDDVSRRRATVALALELAGFGPEEPAARGRFHPRAPLLAGGLLEVEEPERPLPGRSLRVPERVVAHLLGDDTADGALGDPRLVEADPDGTSAPFTRIHGPLPDGTALTVPSLHFDPSGVDDLSLLVREARLRQTGLIVGPLVAPPDGSTRMLARSGVPSIVFGDGLNRHARRIVPAVGWDDLILPPEPAALLRELASRARNRDRVLGEWRLLRGGGRGRGVVALFAGDSGTGKTLAAEVVAAELGVDLYVVDLSAIVDKYIGETEKNLERVFAEADHANAVLLFDEADAVFGRRSEVRDSRDRYANLESAYLLQRLESFSGTAVLTTNLRTNIDDAFTRRLDLVVDFPFPEPAERALLWRLALSGAPRAPDLDPAGVARRYELGGGSIRAAAVTAAYLAAGRDGLLTNADLEAGARREYGKRGHLIVD